MTKKKPQVQIDCEKRAKTHPCPKCGKSNIKNGIFLSTCQYCKASIDVSYIFAPWNHTWEELQALRDKFTRIFNQRTKLK